MDMSNARAPSLSQGLHERFYTVATAQSIPIARPAPLSSYFVDAEAFTAHRQVSAADH